MYEIFNTKSLLWEIKIQLKMAKTFVLHLIIIIFAKTSLLKSSV